MKVQALVFGLACVYGARGQQCAADGSDATFEETLKYSRVWDEDIRIIDATGCPHHTITAQNNNLPQIMDHTIRMRSLPCFADHKINVTCELGILGLGLNGVALFSQAADPECHDAPQFEGGTFDECSGHSTGAGLYHYHIPPACLLTSIMEEHPSYQPSTYETQHSPQVGWALDGLPVYGPRGVGGDYILPCVDANSDPNDCVDECGGHFHSYDGQYAYHYHWMGQIGDGVTAPVDPLPTTQYRTYYPACFRGVVLNTARFPSTQVCASFNLTEPGFVPRYTNITVV